tara:strand:- start:4721 stop:4966 length:246 start_codon:yes stop_codon:yes gene_type:complete
MSENIKPSKPKPKYKKTWRNKKQPRLQPSQPKPEPPEMPDGELHYSEWGFGSYEEMIDYLEELNEHHDPSSGFELDIGGQA